MQLKQKIKFLVSRIKKLPIWVFVIVATFLISLIVYMLFFQDRSVQFSYSEKTTCVQQITLLPSLNNLVDSDAGFIIESKDVIKFGNIQILSRKTCFSTKKAPKVGSTKMSVSLFGSWFAKKTYIINILRPPKISLEALAQPISTSRSLIVKLSDSDAVFSYELEIDGKTADCPMKDSAIYCDIKSLQLLQGKEYKSKIVRLFDNKEVEVIFNENIKTLSATVLVKASISQDQIIYDKPKTFTFDFDKNIETADILLEKVEGDKRSTVTTTTEFNNQQIKATLSNDLERKYSYVLTVNKLEAQDGSTLATPYILNFKTSDGPSVTAVNTDASSAPLTNAIVLTFDQPLSGAQDILKYVSISGISGSIRKTGDNQVSISYANAPLCTDIAVKVNAGLESNNNIVQNDPWGFSTRTICHTTSTIGYSVLGRPIRAYTFGGGGTTILFTGGIHGSEISGSYIMYDWISYLESNAKKIPANKKIVVVPEVNPDGLSISSRYNANNVNIDRNFSSANWAADIDTGSGLMMGGGGKTAMSEPETRALANLTASLQPRLEVSFHAKGSLIGANQCGDSVNIGNHYASSVGYKSMIGQAEQTMGYSITGEYEEWEGERGIPAILIELPTSAGRHFWAHQSILWEMVNL